MSGGWGAAQSRLATFKNNFQTQIALHTHKGHYAIVSVAVSGDMNWHALPTWSTGPAPNLQQRAPYYASED